MKSRSRNLLTVAGASLLLSMTLIGCGGKGKNTVVNPGSIEERKDRRSPAANEQFNTDKGKVPPTVGQMGKDR